MLSVVAGLMAGCSSKEEAPAPIRPVRTMLVQAGASFGGRIFPGRAEAVQAVDIAFEVQGQLVQRPVKVGEVVEQGQLLAQLDARDYQTDLESAQAKLERAKAYRNRINKAAVGAVSEQDRTDAQAQYDVAAANLRLKQKALADTKMVAPFAGTISATYVENHQNVRAKQVVIRLIDMTEIELKIDVPETLVTRVASLQDITVTFDAFPDKPLPATVKEIGKEASTTTRTYPVTLVMAQPDDIELLPGMTGQARGRPGDVDPATSDTFEIAGSAVFEEAGKHYVWVVDETTMTVARQAVETLEVNAVGLLVKGVAAGQRVVTAGVHYLSEGQQVRLLDAAAKDSDS
jgi:RND family efflux transporter MFP subunit